MSKSCCESKSSDLDSLRKNQKSVLVAVLLINSIMFVIEFVYGYISHSSALMADSLDMFGDAAVYAFSLYVLNRGDLWRARAGLVKGVIMAGFGVFVLFQTLYRLTEGVLPATEVMGAVGLAVLAANLVCLGLLYRHRSDDVNMRSVWLCSRNDIIANISVLAAAGMVAWTGSLWPDTLVGLAIAALFLRSSWQVLAEARGEIIQARLL